MQRNTVLTVATTVVAATCAGADHPHVLFDKADLKAIRQRVTAGLPRTAYDTVRRLCEGYAEAETLKPGRHDPLVYLGLAWRVSDDARYGKRLAAEVDRLREADPNAQGIDTLSQKARFDWALVYDLGYDVLSEPSRRWLHDLLVATAAKKHAALAANPVACPGLMLSNLNIPAVLAAARWGVAVVGEPGYRQEWLDRAAAGFRRIFSEFIGPDGACFEHGAYFHYGMSLDGNLMTWALTRKGHDFMEGTNLRKLPVWIAYETVPPESYWLPLGDCSLQPAGGATMRLLLTLMPDDPWMNRAVARMGDGVGATTQDVLAVILMHREPKPADPTGRLPRMKHFRQPNLVHLRSDWTPNALAASFSARWAWGHTHSDVGHFTLWSHGRFWATDSGYGHSASEAHNVVLVDGRGQPHPAAGGEILQAVESPMGALVEADATSSYRERYHGHFDWLTRGPVDGFARARRVFAVLWGDPDRGVPPYALVHDDVFKGRGTHTYDWTMQTWQDHAIELSGQTATIHCPLNDAWIQGPTDLADLPESKQHRILQPVRVPRDGLYDLWVLCRGDAHWRGAYINVWVDDRGVGYMPLRGPTWFWCKVSRRQAKLEAGVHRVAINQNPGKGSVRLKAVMLSSNPKLDPIERRLYNDETTASVLLGSETKIVGDKWRRVSSDRPQPRFGVRFLRPKVTLRQDIYDKTFRFREAHPRLFARAQGQDVRFLTLLYPHVGADKALAYRCRPNRYGYPHQVVWPGAVDYIGDRSEMKGSYGTDGTFFLVRCPTGAGHKPLGKYAGKTELPAGTQYLVANATRLRFEGQEMLAVTDPSQPGRSVVAYGVYVTVLCDGATLTVHAMTAPHAQWQISRHVEVQAFGPQVKEAVVNGKPTAFQRRAPCVVVRTRTQVFTPTRTWVTRRVQQWYDRLYRTRPVGTPARPAAP